MGALRLWQWEASQQQAAPGASRLVSPPRHLLGPVIAALSAACLLEPSVGVVWQLGFSRALGARLSTHHQLLLAAALWLVYSFDHWLDAWRMGSRPALTARHRFMAEQRWPMAVLWLVVLATSLRLAAATLTGFEWACGVSLVIATLGYFFCLHSRAGSWRLKEPAVAVIYTAGATLFSWQHFSLLSLYAAGTFFALVFLNLAALAAMERGVDEHHQQRSLAAGRPHLEHHAKLGALAMLGLACCSVALVPTWAAFFGSVALSSLLLWSCLVLHARAGHEANHLLADAALLAPVLWLLS